MMHIHPPRRHEPTVQKITSSPSRSQLGDRFERCLKFAFVQCEKMQLPDGTGGAFVPKKPQGLTNQAWEFTLTRLAEYAFNTVCDSPQRDDEREMTRQVVGAAKALQLFALLPKFIDELDEKISQVESLAEVTAACAAMRHICTTAFEGIPEVNFSQRFEAGRAAYQALRARAEAMPAPYNGLISTVICCYHERGEQADVRMPKAVQGPNKALTKDLKSTVPYCHPSNYFLGQICLQIPEVSIKARNYLQANDALFQMALSAGQSTRKYRVDSPWRASADGSASPCPAPSMASDVLECDDSKALLREGGFGDLHPKKVWPFVAQYEEAMGKLLADQNVIDIISYLPSEAVYNGPAPRKATICVDPAGKMLPKDIIAHAQRLLGMARQRRKGRTDADRAAMAALGALMDTAKSMRVASQAEQLISFEIMYLVDNATQLHMLHDKLDNLSVDLKRRWAIEDQVATTANAAGPQPKKGQPRCELDPAARAPAAPDAPQQGPAQPQVAQNQQAASTPPVEATVDRALPVRNLVWRGVQLWSRWDMPKLINFVQNNFDAGTFPSAAESLRWHLRKHAVAQMAVEDYIMQAKRAYTKLYIQEVARRAQDPSDFVQVIRHDDVFAVYAWDGRVITYCDKKLCGPSHFPKR